MRYFDVSNTKENLEKFRRKIKTTKEDVYDFTIGFDFISLDDPKQKDTLDKFSYMNYLVNEFKGGVLDE